jgi:hypothetical protein
VRLILVWALMVKMKVEDIVMFIGDIKGAFLERQDEGWRSCLGTATTRVEAI